MHVDTRTEPNQPFNSDIFNLADEKTNIEKHIDWMLSLRMEQRIELIGRFNAYLRNRDKPDVDSKFSSNEIIFALKRGESLHVRDLDGKWLWSYAWSSVAPIKTNWLTGTSKLCELDEIPQLGRQSINNTDVVVLFFKADVDKKQ
jgi:hypothetical protein